MRLDVFMREVICEKCGSRTRNPLPILEQISQRQEVLWKGERRINYACPECNYLTLAPLGEVKIFQDVDLSRFPDDLTIYFVSLACADSNCQSRVVVLAPAKNEVLGVSVSSPNLMSWRNHNATCANGHPPANPLQIGDMFRPAL